MDKREIVAKLRSAKSAHIKWRTYAQALVSGLDVDDDKVPVLHTDCSFGQWYYGSGQSLTSLRSYKALEHPHEMMHQLYLKLFQHMFEEQDMSMFRKLIGKKKSKSEHDAETSKLLKDVIEMSKTLLEAIEVLEADVLHMSEDEIEELV